MEEAIANAFYHCDYRSHTPIVAEVEPYEIIISNATGPIAPFQWKQFKR